MSGLNRYYVTGWSNRYGMWVGEVIEAMGMTPAMDRFAAGNPTLKKLKAYRLRAPAETME